MQPSREHLLLGINLKVGRVPCTTQLDTGPCSDAQSLEASEWGEGRLVAFARTSWFGVAWANFMAQTAHPPSHEFHLPSESVTGICGDYPQGLGPIAVSPAAIMTPFFSNILELPLWLSTDRCDHFQSRRPESYDVRRSRRLTRSHATY